MSMHMIRARASTSSKRKKSNSKRLKQAQADHDSWLESMGIDPKGKKRTKVPGTPLTDIYRKQQKSTEEVKSNITYSDSVPGNGNRKDTIKYTGNEIMGITLNHKSNFEPVRRDNKQAAVDSAQMRRN